MWLCGLVSKTEISLTRNEIKTKPRRRLKTKIPDESFRSLLTTDDRIDEDNEHEKSPQYLSENLKTFFGIPPEKFTQN
jgi:hypothetical protein